MPYDAAPPSAIAPVRSEQAAEVGRQGREAGPEDIAQVARAAGGIRGAAADVADEVVEEDDGGDGDGVGAGGIVPVQGNGEELCAAATSFSTSSVGSWKYRSAEPCFWAMAPKEPMPR